MIKNNKGHNIERNSKKNVALDIINTTLLQYGFTELSLPIYEYYDLLQDTVYNFSDESIIRFMDRNTGKTLVLRPDFTPQVCRIVNGIDNLILPFRASYNGPVFRSVEKDRGIKSEEFQAGWEIFGEDSIFGDIEIIITTYDILNKLGVKGFLFSFGDTVFISILKELLGNNSHEILEAVSNRRIKDLKNLLQPLNINNNLKEFIAKLPLSFGEEDVIDNMINECSNIDNSLTNRLKDIKALFQKLQNYGINKNMLIFDGAESKGLDYYTGIHFEILHPNFGACLGSGGRYDNLMAKFGKNISACGAALNLDNLFNFPICSNNEKGYDYLVLGEENFSKAMDLRKQGAEVIFVTNKNKKDEFVKYYKFKNII